MCNECFRSGNIIEEIHIIQNLYYILFQFVKVISKKLFPNDSK